MSAQNRTITPDEFFTPADLCKQMIDVDNIGTENYIDRNAGHGNWLCVIRDAKIKNGIPLEEALTQIFGCELFDDNAEVIRTKLIDGREDLRPIVERNIVCADALTYHYKFDGSPAGSTINNPELFEF